MARNKSLLSLLTKFRSEARISGNPAHNTQVYETQVNLLQRTQEWLWDEHDWEHLRVERFIELQEGQRFYDLPEDLTIDRLEKIEVRWGADWIPLGTGITAENYAQFDSYTDERSWPVERWQVYEDELIEIWPIPANNSDKHVNPTGTSLDGQLRLKGIRSLSPLVKEDDTADLDDRLIVLYAASEHLAANGAKDAGAKAQAAVSRLNSLNGQMSKTKVFSLFGAGQNQPSRRRARIPTVHYRTNT